MVLTQQVESCGIEFVHACSHTTMVLTQREPTPGVGSSFFGFPYHYGSHATVNWFDPGKMGERFHTTMVLTQRCVAASGRSSQTAFPYHYGSHATHEDNDSRSVHWCFHTTMVLTQPRRTSGLRVLLHVSIPLWFSRNRRRKTWVLNSVFCFHTTMVLTQLIFFVVVLAIATSFPYHYGSHATSCRFWMKFFELWMFPYHYGSHATKTFISTSHCG